MGKYWDVAKQLRGSYNKFKQPAKYVQSSHAPKTGYSSQFDTNVGVKRRAEDDDDEQEQPKKKKQRTENGAAEVKEEAGEGSQDSGEEVTKKKKKKKKDRAEETAPADEASMTEEPTDVTSSEKK